MNASPTRGDGAVAATSVQPIVLAVGLGLIGVLFAWLIERDGRTAALLLTGVLLGLTLYHAAFGFSAAYRRLLVHREVSGVLAQLLMLGVATCLFAPILASGSVFDRPVVGAVAPLGLQVAVGAFLFGVGMQLGGGCGSGTLYAAGGGSTRMLFTLAAFVAGSFWASLHMPWWQRAPSSAPVMLGELAGWPAAVGLQVAVLAVIAVGLRAWGRRGPHAAPSPGRPALRRILCGPWSLAAAAVMLALLNLLTLLLAGHPWTITWAFTLWGAKAAALLGWDPGTASFWGGAFQQAKLNAGILEDVTSVMDIGIVLGALCAASLSGRFSPRLGLCGRSLAAAIIGGLAMGYGARIAFGCNVGAFFSGVASTSLHGWLWIAAALPGNWLGVRLRPLFGMAN